MSETTSEGNDGANQYQGFCCAMKHYYMHQKNLNLIDTLQITPRVIIYKKKFKITDSYLQSLNIKNTGLVPRRCRYFTDSPIDTTLVVEKHMMDRDIAPEDNLVINIKIEPNEKKAINRLRHIYIEVEHPNCIIEVPIIVLHGDEISFSREIKFPRSVRNSKTFYELIIYNPTKEAMPIKIMSKRLKIKQSAPIVKGKDFMRVLLTFNIKDMISVSDQLTIKIGKSMLLKSQIRNEIISSSNRGLSPNVNLLCFHSLITTQNNEKKTPTQIYCEYYPNSRLPDEDYHSSNYMAKAITTQIIRRILSQLKYPYDFIYYTIEIKPDTLFIGVSHIDFKATKYRRTSEKEFTVCNESSKKVNFNIKFLTEEDEEVTAEILPKDAPITDEDEPKSLKSTEASAISLERVVKCEPIDDNFDRKAFQHFALKPMLQSLKPHESIKFTIVFKPETEFTDYGYERNPPYLLKTKIFFTIVEELSSETKYLTVSGLIDGLEAKVTPAQIDLRKVYIGEEHCESINAYNMDEICDESIYFMDYKSPNIATCTINPKEGIHLQPGKEGHFTLMVYAINSGKFNLRLRFKVKYGSSYFVVVKGIAIVPQVRHFPGILEFGSVPIAVPQKRYLLIMNPLSVPMTLQCRAVEDGSETPLTFNIFNTDGFLPLTVKNPIKQILSKDDEYDANDTAPVIFTDEEIDKRGSFHSVVDAAETASFSTKFEDEVLVHISDFAYETVWDIRKRKVLEKAEAEKKTMQLALEHLRSLSYFDEMNMSNYKYMDWNALPSDPIEIYVDTEVIYLNPNTGKKLTVVLIPNVVGYFSRAIEVRCCPINIYTKDIDPRERDYVETELMTSKIWLEYNCRVPDIQWEELIDFHNRTIYAGAEYNFMMTFANVSSTGGFLYFDVVPDCDAGEMFFPDNQWKFYCEAELDTTADCAVRYKKWGEIKLSGIIRIVGLQKRFPFHIFAFVLPQKLKVTPSEVYHRFQVLEKRRFYIWIENVTPTPTSFSLEFKHEPLDIYLDTAGGLLSPSGQGVVITAIVKFYDPDNYRNSLYIKMHYGKQIEVPIYLLVEGMPVIFTPNIKQGLDAGVILSNTEEDFNAGEPKYFKEINVQNHGRRTYRLTLHKAKNIEHSGCALPATKVKITVEPKFLLLNGGETGVFQIAINAFEAADVYNQFRVHIVDTTNLQRFLDFCFAIRAKFVLPELNWVKREMTMVYRRTHVYKEQIQMVVAELRNDVDCAIENVQLKATGPIRMKLFLEDKFQNEIHTSFAASEIKEIIVALNKRAIGDKLCAKVMGRIQCIANGRAQRTFVLHIKILMPLINIPQPHMIIFGKEFESVGIVEIENIGRLEGQFIWKKQEERRNFVGEFDDVSAFAREVLSDLLHMLELSDDEGSSDEDSIFKQNLTLRYQKYRCKLITAQHEDPIDIRGIILEVVEGLDLEHKRYAMSLGDSDSMCCWEIIEQAKKELLDTTDITCDECAENTVKHIIANLKIEDSYDLTEASSDHCGRENTIYFIEKRGVLEAGAKMQCLLHLPKVKKGYAVQAVFILDVIGGYTKHFTAICVNLEKTVEILGDNIYLGMKPWYEQYATNFKILNVTQYPINLHLNVVARPDKKKHHRLSDGYVEICGPKIFGIGPIRENTIKLTGIMGFSEEFIRDVKIHVNDSEELSVRIRGQGIMPIFALIGKDLKRIEQTPIDIALEYALLQRIYQFDVFKSITEYDDDLPFGAEEDHAESIAESSTITMLSASSDNTGRVERKFFKLLKTYVFVYNNAELPNAIVLDQLLETEKFLERLRLYEDLRNTLQMVYNSYIKERANFDRKMPLNLKHYTVQPLPFELHGYLLTLGEMRKNQPHEFEIKLHFFGPGKLIAAARTEIKVPGLQIYFDIVDALDKKSDEYIFYNSCSESHFCLKPYRNIFERVIDEEHGPFFKRGQSYDDYSHQHKRTIEERACIKEYYNSLNKSVYVDHKHHWIHCKVYSKTKKNYTGTILRVIIMIKPLEKFYEVGQLFEENLYIDLHMGPTLPILMRGIVIGN